MILMRWIIAATLLAGVAPTSSLTAEDLSLSNPGGTVAPDPKDVRQSDVAEAGQVHGDDAARITDLEFGVKLLSTTALAPPLA